jgi:hypothetical protein
MAGGSKCVAEIGEDCAGATPEPFWEFLLFCASNCSLLGLLSKNGSKREEAKLLETMEKSVLYRIAWNSAVFG